MKRAKRAPLLILATKAPTDREKIWAAMRQEKSFTQSRIAHLAQCPQGKVQDCLKGFMAAGYVSKRVRVRMSDKAVYDLIKDTGVEVPRLRKDGTPLPPSGRTRMWNAMRVLGTFTIPELARAASLPDAPVSEEEAEYYCRWLRQGCYVAQQGEVLQFIPARFTGAKAPQILRIKALFDPNLGKVICEARPDGRDDE